MSGVAAQRGPTGAAQRGCLSADFILGLLGAGWAKADIFASYPGLTRDDIAACLAYASEVLQAEKVYPLPPARTA
ncbi:MAG: DUF433 domain-containing protein [Dongiaceae bacterium]